MTFDQVFSALKDEKKVRRSYWGTNSWLLLGRDENKRIFMVEDGKKLHKDVTLDAEDLMANDWESV